jgi:hypothetical protein
MLSLGVFARVIAIPVIPSIILFSFVMLSSCSPGDARTNDAEAAEAVAPKPPRFDPDDIAAAKKAIVAEPKVIDLLFDDSNVVEWHVAVVDDGTRRYGYATYICHLLKENGAYDDQVDVRIVDAAKRKQFKNAYRDYSLGAVRCSSGDAID